MIIGIGICIGTRKVSGQTVKAPIVRDSFNRLDASSLRQADTAQPWTAHIGVWGTDGNRAYCVSDAGGNIATLDTLTADYKLSATLSGQTDAWEGNSRYLNLVFRCRDASNYMMARNTKVFDDNLEIYKCVNGSLTKIANMPAYDVNALDHVISAKCQGARVIVGINGVDLIDYMIPESDLAALASNTRVGLRLTRTGSTSVPATAENLMVEGV